MALAVAVLLAVGAIVFTLFVRVKDLPELAPVSPAAHLEERKAQIYENLRDLQFEFRLGKLSDRDYQKTKVDLQRELARVLGEIDSMKPAIAAAQAKAAKAPAAATATSAKGDANVATSARGDANAATSAKGDANNVKRESNVCPHCGAKFPLALKFCGECGKALAS